MNKSKNKGNEWYYKWWIWAIIIFLFLFIKSRTENPISPIILALGLLCVAFSFYKIKLTKKSQSEENQKTPDKNINIIMVIGIILAFLGYSTLGIRGDIQEKEKLLKAEFIGIGENSSPLCASNLKLFKKGNIYTVIGDFKKTSQEPKESYFDYEIILIDKHGKYIETKKVSTKPSTSNDSDEFFTFETSKHFEEEIYIYEGNKPVRVEFANIKEYSKQDFINLTTKDTKNTISSPQQATQTTDTPKKEASFIIGSDKEAVRSLLSNYEEKTSIEKNALWFENKDVLVTVYFNAENIADGVVFMQNDLDGVNTTTGEGSYISRHYDELVKLATNDSNVKIESDLTKYNKSGLKKYAMNLYIGNIPTESNVESPDSDETDTGNSNSEISKENSSPDFVSIVFLNVGLKVYQYKSDTSYIGTIKKVDRDYKDENGKKVGAVYLEGGAKDGWYIREDITRCFARSDDPFLNYSYK